MSTTILARLDELDTALARKGFPRLSSWWKQTLRRFYGSRARQLVVRCGRRGGKSSTLCRVAVVEALYGDHVIQPGDVGICGFISVSRDEAAQRLRMIRAILDAIGVRYKPIDGGIELEHKPIAFKVFTASVAGVVGGTWIALFGDELSRWRDSESGANPAKQVLESARPTLAGMPSARMFLSSSARGSTDAHATLIDQGETEFQQVAIATTWEARPELTEADCRALEPDYAVFLMEYGSIPHDGTETSLMVEADLLACTRKGLLVLPPESGVTYAAAMDPASRANAWTLCIARSITVAESTSVQVALCREWRAPRGGSLDSDLTLSEIAEVIRGYRVDEVFTDQWSYGALSALARRNGFELRQEVATQASKVQLFDALKRQIVDRTIELPDDPQVRADLLGVRRWLSRNGAFSIELERSGGRHSDHAPSIALAVSKAVDDAGGLPLWATERGIEGMRQFMHGGGPTEGYSPHNDPDFGRPTRRGPDPIQFSRNIGGFQRADGVEPRFVGMRADWSRPSSAKPRWSASCTPDFKTAVREFITAHPY